MSFMDFLNFHLVPGIVLGYVQELELDTNGLFKSGTVLLDPRLNELHEVAVLVPLNPEPE